MFQHVSRPCASKEWGMKGEQRIEKGRICYIYAESLFYFIVLKSTKHKLTLGIKV